MDIVSHSDLIALAEPPGKPNTNKSKNADRWRANQPVGASFPSLRTWVACVSIGFAALLIIIALVCTLLAGNAFGDGPVDDRPVLYLFGFPGCAYCDILEKALTDDLGDLRRFDTAYNIRKVDVYDKGPEATAVRKAFLSTIPEKLIPVDVQPSGLRDDRLPGDRIASVPVLWVDGRSDYWSGFHRTDVDRLAGYLERVRPVSPGVVPNDPPKRESTPVVSTPQAYERELTPSPDPRFSASLFADAGDSPPVAVEVEPVATVADPNIAPPNEDFAGVTVVLLVSSLTENHAAIRAELARRANDALQGLVRKNIGDRVDAYLITEVGDPETFERLVETVGVRPGVGTSKKVAALVLIPERLEGLQGWIIEKVETSLAGHYLPGLKQAGLMPIVERIHGDTYGAVLAALVAGGGGSLPTNQPLIYLVVAYLSERSKVGTWLARRFGWVA